MESGKLVQIVRFLLVNIKIFNLGSRVYIIKSSVAFSHPCLYSLVSLGYSLTEKWSS